MDTASAPSLVRWGTASSEKAASQPSAPRASVSPFALMPPPAHWTPAAPAATTTAARITRPLSGRHAAHDHADRGRVGLAHALDHEQVEEHEPGGGEGEQPEGLSEVEPRKPPTGHGEQHQAGGGIAKRLPRSERIALDEVGGGDQRAHKGEGAGGQQRSAERR